MIQVFAPLAEKLLIEINGSTRPLQPLEGGYWRSPEALPDGTLYSFYINGKGPYPDPRSSYQPRGVFGPSCVIDHSKFVWSHSSPRSSLKDAVLYELHLGTFTPEGTYLAALQKLDHLVELGVTHVELMPLHSFAGKRGWGYDGVSLFAPFEGYGHPNDLKRLIDACHQRGLAVLLDVVYNHLGPSGNFLGRFGPYFSKHFTTPWGPAVNLDQAYSDPVRRFFLDNALYWLKEYRFDGLRLDAIHMMIDHRATHFLEELSEEVEKLSQETGRALLLIGESGSNDPRITKKREEGGLGLDAVWSDDFHNALHVALTHEEPGYYRDFTGLASLSYTLENGFFLDGRYSHYYQRRHGRRFVGEKRQLLGYLQNHDQVGNRPQGERIGHLVSLGLCKVGAALCLLAPFTPMLFMGEEWAASTPFYFFTDHPEERLGKAVLEGRRKEFRTFGWPSDHTEDPQALQTFLQSKLRWEERDQGAHQEMLDWYQALIRLRRTTQALVDSTPQNTQTRFDEEARWLILQRGSLLVACNFSKETRALPIRTRKLLLSSEKGAQALKEEVILPKESVLIVEV